MSRASRKTEAVASEEPSEYELQIQRNKEANKALMAKVLSGALIPMAPPQPEAKKLATTKAKTPVRSKRKAEPAEPTRRSTRTSKKVIQHQELPDDSDFDSDVPKKKKKKTGIRTSKREVEAPDSEENPPKAPRVNGKVFGPIEGVEVGTWWEYRDECGRAGVHPPTVAGIYGSAAEGGAYSIAVSAGYPEDRDLGDTFTYTGSGGRELRKKNLRTAPQSSDQTLVRGNAALDMSAKTGNPVRVIRGYKAALGPVTGYRYDGLYKVVRSYTALNAEGKYKVYKFDLERLPGQPPVDYSHKERIQAEAAEAGAAPPTPPASSDEETENSNGDAVDQQQVQTPPASGDEGTEKSNADVTNQQASPGEVESTLGPLGLN